MSPGVGESRGIKLPGFKVSYAVERRATRGFRVPLDRGTVNG